MPILVSCFPNVVMCTASVHHADAVIISYVPSSPIDEIFDDFPEMSPSQMFCITNMLIIRSLEFQTACGGVDTANVSIFFGVNSFSIN